MTMAMCDDHRRDHPGAHTNGAPHTEIARMRTVPRRHAAHAASPRSNPASPAPSLRSPAGSLTSRAFTLHSPRMQVHSRDSPLMPRQLVQDLPTLDFPDRHCPISAAHSYSRAIVMPRPSHTDEGGFKPCGSTREGSVDPHRVGREGTDIVDDESGVEGVGCEKVARGRKREGGDLRREQKGQRGA